LRIDRLISVYMIHPLLSISLAAQAKKTPVLMYHSISEDSEASIAPYYRTCTTPAVFADHMALLKTEGYKAMGLCEGLKTHHPEDWGRKRKKVILTFDDGFRDFFTTAFPILQQHGFGATVFLPTAYIGNTSIPFKGRPCMTWSEARALSQSGIEFGSHTHSHPVLHKLHVPQIRSELEISRTTIKNQLGVASSFSYPYAFPSADHNFTIHFSKLLQEAGYDFGVTTRIGRTSPTDSPFTLKRLPINSGDDSVFFRTKLAGDYDWMALPQALVKILKQQVMAYQHSQQT